MLPAVTALRKSFLPKRLFGEILQYSLVSHGKLLDNRDMIVLLIPQTLFLILLLRAEFKQDTAMIKIFKPTETCLIIVLAVFGNLYATTAPGMLILFGLLFSLAGDIALIHPEEKKRFAAGLGTFLVAHMLYIASFIILVPGHWLDPRVLAVTGILLVLGTVIYILMLPGLKNMKIPVAGYMIFISLMVLRSFCVFRFIPNESIYHSKGLFIFVGAALFYVSDVILALNRFYRQMKYNRMSLVFYYGGQTLIAMTTIVSEHILF